MILNKFLSLYADDTLFSVKGLKRLFFFFLNDFTTILLSHSEPRLGAILHYIFPLSQLKVIDEASQATLYTLKTLCPM